MCKKAKTLGYTQDVNTCYCCGKKDLKGTVALTFDQGETIEYYGVICAAKAANKNSAYIKKSIQDAEIAKQNALAFIKERVMYWANGKFECPLILVKEMIDIYVSACVLKNDQMSTDIFFEIKAKLI